MKNTVPIKAPMRREHDEERMLFGAKAIRLDAFMAAQEMQFTLEQIEYLVYSGYFDFKVEEFTTPEGEEGVMVDMKLWSSTNGVYVYPDDMTDLDMMIFSGLIHYYGDMN